MPSIWTKGSYLEEANVFGKGGLTLVSRCCATVLCSTWFLPFIIIIIIIYHYYNIFLYFKLLNCPYLNIQVELWFSSQFHQGGGGRKGILDKLCDVWSPAGLKTTTSPQTFLKRQTACLCICSCYLSSLSCWSCMVALQEKFEKQLSNG